MSLGNTSRGTGTHNAGASSFTLSPGSDFSSSGSMAVLCIAADNSSSGGDTNDFGSVTDTLGNTWTLRQAPLQDPASTNAGVQGAIYTTPQNGGKLVTSTTITVNFGSSPVAKAWTLTEVTGTGPTFVTGGNGTGSNTGTPTVTSGSIAINDMIVGAGFKEGPDNWTGDSDTTNGSWSTKQSNGLIGSTTGIGVVSQCKTVTSAGTQTYDPTCTASDVVLAWIEIAETQTFTASAAVTTGNTTCSGTATFTKPTYTGSAAVSIGNATCAGSATFTKPTYSGTAAVTTGSATCSGASGFVVGTVPANKLAPIMKRMAIRCS